MNSLCVATVGDDQKCFFVLNSLLPCYDTVVSQVNYQLATKIDYIALKEAVIKDDESRTSRQEAASTSTALAAKSNLPSKPASKPVKPHPKHKPNTSHQSASNSAATNANAQSNSKRGCANCGKQEHTTTECKATWILPCRICLRPSKQAVHRESECPTKSSTKRHVSCLATLGLAASQLNPTAWYADSGASKHMSQYRDLFVDYTPTTEHTVTGIGNKELHSAGIGKVNLPTSDGILTLTNVVHFPNLGTNLFSTNYARKLGCKIVMEDDTCIITKGEEVVVTGKDVDDLIQLVLDTNSIAATAQVNSSSTDTSSPQGPVGGIGKGKPDKGKELEFSHPPTVVSDIGSTSVPADGMGQGKPDNGKELEFSHLPTDSATNNQALLAQQISVANFLLWHDQLGHISNDRLCKTAKIVNGIGPLPSTPHFNCVACCEGKAHAAPIYDNPIGHADKPGELTHTDVSGPHPASINGNYTSFALYIDQKTGHGTVYFTAGKGGTPQTFDIHTKRVNNQYGYTMKRIRCDNGGEYVNAAIKYIVEKYGIIFKRTAPHTPQQNGVAERRIQALWSIARCLLRHSQLPASFWAYAISLANFIINRTVSRSIDSDITFHELWTGERPNISCLRMFGCRAKVLIQTHITKTASRTRDGIYLGPSSESAGDIFYMLDTCKVVVSRNATFFEADKLTVTPLKTQDSFVEPSKDTVSYGMQSGGDINTSSAHNITHENLATRDSEITQRFSTATVAEPQPVGNTDSIEDTNSGTQASSSETSVPEIPLPRPTRTVRPVPENDPDFFYEKQAKGTKSKALFTCLLAYEEPKTHGEALSSADAALWKEAMNAESQSLCKNNTYTLCPLPPGHKAIKCKWVFKRKLNEKEDIE